MPEVRPEILKLVSFCSDLEINAIPEARLADYTTFRLGGKCRCLCHCRFPDQVEDLIRFLSANEMPFIMIGGGSNLLVSDNGVECVVIRYWTDVPHIELRATTLKVTAATQLDDVVLFSAEHGLAGLNFLSGIYGTVGGAIVGNAGAFGRQIGECLSSVDVTDSHGHSQAVASEQLEFGYRDSALKMDGRVVLEAVFTLVHGDRNELLKKRNEFLALRREKHPDLKRLPSAGSFFKNIIPDASGSKRQAAGWFLEQVGAKDLRVNSAAVFERHANIIVKKEEDCSSQDVFDLSQLMAERVKKSFGLGLAREVRLVGYFKGDNPSAPLIR